MLAGPGLSTITIHQPRTGQLIPLQIQQIIIIISGFKVNNGFQQITIPLKYVKSSLYQKKNVNSSNM